MKKNLRLVADELQLPSSVKKFIAKPRGASVQTNYRPANDIVREHGHGRHPPPADVHALAR
jgi:hypothetical protein